MSHGNYHLRSLSGQECYTQEYVLSGQDRRASADDKEAGVDSAGSRPVPLPRRPNTSMVQFSRPQSSQQGDSEIERLQTQVDTLLIEQKGLQRTIEAMKKREADLIRREDAVSKLERDLSLRENHMNSKFSDEEFKINQKKRDLQMLEDQLHMKSKDLQHKEFDLLNADGPMDISSSKMADLADRTYELEKREEELKRKQEQLEGWDKKLGEDNDNYRRRMSDLLRMEADLRGSVYASPDGQESFSTQHQALPLQLPSSRQLPPPHQLTHDQVYTDPRYVNREDNQDWNPALPYKPETGMNQQQTIPASNSEAEFGRSESVPFLGNPLPPPSPPQNEPIFSPLPTVDDDEALARQLMEEENKLEEERRQQRLIADQLLALQLQDEDLMGTDSVANASQLSAGEGSARTEDVIKRDLGSRLTQQHLRQQREQEDLRYAQNLLEENNNSESNN